MHKWSKICSLVLVYTQKKIQTDKLNAMTCACMSY